MKLKNCICCGKKLYKNAKYCSCKCQSTYEYHKYISEWLAGKHKGMKGPLGVSSYIRRYLFEINESRCQECGWDKLNPITKKCPLEVHHIDGNHHNNKLSNLRLLCLNCHSLTYNYKNLSKKGRVGRK